MMKWNPSASLPAASSDAIMAASLRDCDMKKACRSGRLFCCRRGIAVWLTALAEAFIKIANKLEHYAGSPFFLDIFSSQP